MRSIPWPRPVARFVLDQVAAGQHRDQRERHDGRHQHGDAHHRGELMEQQADHAGHEENRDEHRDQRQRNRNDGKAHLLRSLQRGLQRRHAMSRRGARCSPAPRWRHPPPARPQG